MRLIEEALVIRLLQDDCGYRLVREGEPAELLFDLRVKRWWESERPGGARRFDPATGRQHSGVIVEVELGYDARVVPAAGGRPLAERSRVVRRSESTQRNPLWDPRRRAREAAFDAAARDLEKLGCRVVRKRAREAARGARAR